MWPKAGTGYNCDTNNIFGEVAYCLGGLIMVTRVGEYKPAWYTGVEGSLRCDGHTEED